jgi:hypothetical protein
MNIVVDPRKILNYLLVEQDKSNFFRAFGYSEANRNKLHSDLMGIARNNAKNLRQRTIYGDEYEMIGAVITPNGREITIKSGWIVDDDRPDLLRFVTAYPA